MLNMMMRVEIEVLVCIPRLTVYSDDDRTIGLSSVFRVQKRDSAFLLNIVGKLDVWVNRVQVCMEFVYELFMDVGVAIVDVPVPPLFLGG